MLLVRWERRAHAAAGMVCYVEESRLQTTWLPREISAINCPTGVLIDGRTFGEPSKTATNRPWLQSSVDGGLVPDEVDACCHRGKKRLQSGTL